MKIKRKPLPADPVSPSKVLNILQEGVPLTKEELLKELRASRRSQKKLMLALEELQKKREVFRIAEGRYAAAQSLPRAEGELEIKRKGNGFVLTPHGTHDIYVSQDGLGDAWNGDTVEVVLLPDKQGKNPEGRVLRILQRKTTRLIARVLKRLGHRHALARPAGHYPFLIRVLTEDLSAPVGRDSVLIVEVEKQIEPELWEGKAFEILGSQEDARVQEKIVKLNLDIPTAFPEAVIKELAAFPDTPTREDFKNRRDLRDLPFVTIDGDRAKDFDDAVFVEKWEQGWTLRVAIADVSHYVQSGSSLDAEALKRSNSYYFPGSVEAMLPEKLSNGLCSLRPGVPRLAVVTRIRFNSQAVPVDSDFCLAVIQSHARLTYSQVAALLNKGTTSDPQLKKLLPMLEEARKLALALLDRMHERGCLDLDVPEPEFLFDEKGRVTGIVREERTFAHRMIEMFMIAANEAVASCLAAKSIPILYRVHPAPDPEKLETLFAQLRHLGISVPKEKSDDAALRLFLRNISTTQGIEGYVLNKLLLRSMMQARYECQNIGHFGLGSSHYCHFTSPIRRYADLSVHRALKKTLLKQQTEELPSEETLAETGALLNKNERKAQEGERDIQKRLGILLLQDRIGDDFSGIISAITDFGIFVELEKEMIEGMIPLSSLDDDYYVYLPDQFALVGERTGKRFVLGQRLEVRLANVNIDEGEVTLEMASPYPLARRERRGKAGERASQRKASPALSPRRPRSPMKSRWQKKKDT